MLQNAPPLIVRELVDFLIPGLSARGAAPDWPPDAFAICATLLQRSGAYPAVLADWPPDEGLLGRSASSTWNDAAREIGASWRRACSAGQAPPEEVATLWGRLVEAGSTRLNELRQDGVLCHALLALVALSDEACEGVGGLIHVGDDAARALFVSRANALLLTSGLQGASTLCVEVDGTRMRVLPKGIAPQVGLTLRSLTHHLSACAPTEMAPRWHPAVASPGEELNVLVVPWPFELSPHGVRGAEPGDEMRNMPARFGFFTYDPNAEVPDGAIARIAAIIEDAAAKAGTIHCVVLPELSLSPERAAELWEAVSQKGAFLICGVGRAAEGGRPGTNAVGFYFPGNEPVFQHKHHRWKVNGEQAERYSLSLDPNRDWWEYISLQDRRFHFFLVRDRLVVTGLVCEDLARPDPVGDLIRAVGPSLVVALLMDGPQIESRWPGRYGTVLADDPGCSVLTVSSLGMVLASKPPPDREHAGRVVALWRDAARGPREIKLPDGHEAVVLKIRQAPAEQWTADGRSDQGRAVRPVLEGDPVYVPCRPPSPNGSDTLSRA